MASARRARTPGRPRSSTQGPYPAWPRPTRTISVIIRAPSRPATAVATGLLRISPRGGQALRVPWAIGFTRPTGSLVGRPSLDRTIFKPSALSEEKADELEQQYAQFVDGEDDGSHTGSGLGQQTMPETLHYSVVGAIQTLWLAARADGIDVVGLAPA